MIGQGAPQTLVTALERSADIFADRCALVHEGACLNYPDLWRRANALALWLERQGLQRGDRAALVLENSLDYVVAYYGALRAGAIVVPLNASAKSRDIAMWLRNSGAAWVFGAPSDELRAALATMEPRPRQVLIGTPPAGWRGAEAWDEAIGVSGSPRTRPPHRDEPASILYTSGTTGHPKGVLLSHANLASNTASIIEYLGLTHADSIVSLLPFYYSYGNSVLHTHLAAGGRIVLESNFVYPQVIVERLSAERCTGFAGVPSTFALLLARVPVAQYDLSSLRYVTQAGGPMSPALTLKLREALPNSRLFVMYGQTEATARLTYLPPERLVAKLGSVGIPLRDVEIEIRADDGSNAGVGQTGDVWVRGPNVMMGYWQDPEATAAALQAGWLRTGDSGYLDDEGYLYLAGRRSDIIKTGAHRVHPKDVEDVIAEIEGIAEVAVVGVDDGILGQAIKAFLVPAPGVTLDLMRIKAQVRAQLSNYKVPKYIEVVSALPKTSTGKIRRVALGERTSS